MVKPQKSVVKAGYIVECTMVLVTKYNKFFFFFLCFKKHKKKKKKKKNLITKISRAGFEPRSIGEESLYITTCAKCSHTDHCFLK